MLPLSLFARNSCSLTVLILLLGTHVSSMSVRLILFGIDCAYTIFVRPLHDFGVSPKFIRIAPLAFAEYDSDCRFQAEQFQDSVFFGYDFPDYIL